MDPLTRRAFLHTSFAATALAPLLAAEPPPAKTTHATSDLDERIHGLLLGTALGDAIGGPIEFQAPDAIQKLPDPPKAWRDADVLDAAARTAAGGRLRLRSYRDLRLQPESYGQWNVGSEPGTITDDTRHKVVLLHALRVAEQAGRWPFGVRDLAQAYLDWPQTPAVTTRPDYAPLAADWLEEWQLAARWVLGERDLKRARPPERMWQGLPTCCGQMTLLPLAALYAGQPDRAYRAAYHLAFFDNGFGRDLNAALVAALAVALVTPVDPASPRAAWDKLFAALRGTDPFGHAQIRWTQRAVDRWLDLALRSAREAQGRPARMFAVFDREFAQNAKWEAQIPFVVAFGCVALAEGDPLAALQLTQEWGWDTDSYAQVLGAFLGALYGPTLFPAGWRTAVAARLQADHGVMLADEARRLSRLRLLAQQKTVVRDD